MGLVTAVIKEAKSLAVLICPYVKILLIVSPNPSAKHEGQIGHIPVLVPRVEPNLVQDEMYVQVLDKLLACGLDA